MDVRLRPGIGLVVCLSLLLCGGALRAHGPVSGEAVLSGTVVDADANAPVERAIVQLEAGATVVTDDAGTFRLDHVHPGERILRVEHLGYQPHRLRIVLAPGAERRVIVELHPQPIVLSRTLVESDRAALSLASDRAVREFDLRTRPATAPRHLLEVVPGLITVGQAGGRASSLLLRGFDNGFGTDVAFDVDGLPVNLVSHGHGQGYADLAFLIPETVETLEVYKGPYFPEYGNLANAAQIVLRTRTHLHGNSVTVSWGRFGAAGGTLLFQLPTPSLQTNAYVAARLEEADGPYTVDQDLRRLSLLVRAHHRLSESSTLDVSLSGYGSSWDEPGLVAGRAVDAGRVSRFGTHNDSQGGSTSRQSAIVRYATGAAADRHLEITGYASLYEATLYNDVSFYALDPIFGGMTEQGDRRVVTGFDSRYAWPHALGPVLARGAVGVSLRADDIALETWQVVRRRRYWPLVEADVNERNLSAWGREELLLGHGLRLVLGARLDRFQFAVDDGLETFPDVYIKPVSIWLRDIRASGKTGHIPLVQPHASGVAQATVVSPKASLAWSPHRAVDLFVNAGRGFHSNDARTAVVGRVAREQSGTLEDLGATAAEIQTILDTLAIDSRLRDVGVVPRTAGGEIGLRLRLERPGVRVPRPPLHRWSTGAVVGHYPTAGNDLPRLPVRLTDRANLGAALWWIDVDEEYIYDSDVARPEPRGRTRRWGLDLELRAQLAPWLWADADLNLARARLRDADDGADAIPLAPRRMAVGGLSARRGQWEAGLRLRHLGDRPATADGELTAVGYSLLAVSLGREWGRWHLTGEIDNVLDSDWREVQVPLETVLVGEGPFIVEGPPPPEVHYSAGSPRAFRVRLSAALGD